jgi:hypothetical protein
MIEEGIRKSNGRGEFDQSTLSTSIEMLQWNFFVQSVYANKILIYTQIVLKK